MQKEGASLLITFKFKLLQIAFNNGTTSKTALSRVVSLMAVTEQ